jgi:hypothetical protein
MPSDTSESFKFDTSLHDCWDWAILVGAMLRLPVPGRRELVECQSVLYRYLNLPKEEIELVETRSKMNKTNGKFFMLVNDDIFVDSYDWQLKNVLYHLKRHYRVDAHLRNNTQNKQRIDAIRISGIFNMDDIKDTIHKIVSR